MKKTYWMLALLLAALMALPAVSLADIDNSKKITKDLPSDLENLTINASNVDIKLKVVPEGKAPYVEMDATVFGIHASDVTYKLDVSQKDNATVIDVNHNGKDFGINDVDINIYIPGQLKNLELHLNDSDMDMKSIYAQILTGELVDSEIDGDSMEVYHLTTKLERSDLDIRGIVGGVDMTTYASDIDVRTSLVPEGLVITGSDSDVDLRIPRNFSLAYDVKTGYFHTNVIDEYHEHEGTIHYGVGGPQFTVTLEGGSLDVREAK